MSGIRERKLHLKPELRETLAKLVEHPIKRDTGKVWEDTLNTATGNAAIPQSKRHISVRFKAEHGCGDRSSRSNCKFRELELGRVTILKKGKSPLKTEGKAGSNEPFLTSRLPGGGSAEPGQAPHGGSKIPPKRREEWTPYTSSTSNPAPSIPAGSEGTSQGSDPAKRKASKGRQKGQGGSELCCPPALTGMKLIQDGDPRWYSSSPLPDLGTMPFRRKRNVNLEASVSWADDEYWGSWNRWDEVIQWGDEDLKRRQRTKGGRRNGRRETHRKKSWYQSTPLSDSIGKSRSRTLVTSEK